MLYNEERPHSFDEMVGQKHIVENLRNQSKEDKWFQVYILAGQFGGGKTTMARIIALASNCKHKEANGNPCLECESCKLILSNGTSDIMEIDAASNTGVDNIRDLKESTSYKPLNLSKKIYIIDEVHMISKQAFNALLKILEEPPQNTIFILCTTDLMAIPATVRSRAAIYIFEQISFADIFAKLENVSNRRSYNISKNALVLIAKNAQGSMRNAYGLLQQITSGSDKCVEESDVQQILGLSDTTYIFDLLKSIINAEPGDCILKLEKAAALGKDMSLMVNDMIDIVANAIIGKSASIDIIHETDKYKELLSEIVSISYLDQLCHIADGLMDIRVNLRRCPEKTTVAVGIIRITTSAITTSFISRLKRLEEMLENGQVVSKEAIPDEIQDKCMDSSVTNSKSADIVSDVYYEDVGKAAGVDVKPNEINTVIENEIVETVNSTSDMASDIKDEEVIENEMDYFDMFSLFEEFNSINVTAPSIPSEIEQTGKTEDVLSKQRRLEERLKLVSEEDSVFTAALMGCAKSMKDGMLVLETPLKPVYDIVDAYISATNIEEVEVIFDPLITLV